LRLIAVPKSFFSEKMAFPEIDDMHLIFVRALLVLVSDLLVLVTALLVLVSALLVLASAC
jgi:hypothetical protein